MIIIMVKIFLYSNSDDRNTILTNPNIDFIKSLGYNCVTIEECPNICKYMKNNDIKNCVCILHIVDYTFKYLLSNEDFVKSDNYIFVYYADLHPTINKEFRHSRLTESLRLISNSPNAYMYGPGFYTMKMYHGFFPKDKIINDIYNSVNDNFLLNAEPNMSPKNMVLVSGAMNKSYYPARNKMVSLAESNHEITRLKYDVSLIGKKYLEILREYLCCFTCSLCNYTPYLVYKFFEIPSTGSLLLAHDDNIKEHMKKLGFIDGENYISCTIKNMLEKVKYICNPSNRAEIDRIRFNGYKLVLNHHKMSYRMAYLDKIINGITYTFLHKKYLCPDCNIVYRKAPSIECHRKMIHSDMIGMQENNDSSEMDKYCMPINYINQLNKSKDIHIEEDVQVVQDVKEILNEIVNKVVNENNDELYNYVSLIIQSNKFTKIINIGGNASKLLGNEGVEIMTYDLDKNFDLVFLCNTLEYLLEPDDLIKFIRSFNATYFIISTDCRNVLYKKFSSKGLPISKNGPPVNESRIREWTFIEFQLYLKKYFRVLKSFLGRDQTECQWHLCEKYKYI
jgi:hypothetical protein